MSGKYLLFLLIFEHISVNVKINSSFSSQENNREWNAFRYGNKRVKCFPYGKRFKKVDLSSHSQQQLMEFLHCKPSLL